MRVTASRTRADPDRGPGRLGHALRVDAREPRRPARGRDLGRRGRPPPALQGARPGPRGGPRGHRRRVVPRRDRWAATTTSRCGSPRAGSPSPRPSRSRRTPRSRRRQARLRPTSCRRSSSSPGPVPSIATRRWPASRSSRSWPTASPTPGFIVVRYDKRGVGQSGGRDESATIQDYADDVRAVVEFLRKRKDVDPAPRRRRRAQRGRAGGPAGRRQRGEEEGDGDRAPGDSRHDWRRTGARAAAVPPRQAEAAGGGEAEPHRAAAEDPGGRPSAARAGRRFRRPIESRPTRRGSAASCLRSLEGDRTESSSPSSSSRPSATGRCRRRGTASCCSTPPRAGRSSPTPSLVTIDGVNHLFVPAETGDVDEYALLQDKRVSPKVTGCARAVVEGQAPCGCCGRWTLTPIIPCRSGSCRAPSRPSAASGAADFCLDVPLVSRLHCRVEVAADGEVEILDLDSTNGTWIDGVRITRAPLRPGSVLRVGRVEFTLEAAS